MNELAADDDRTGLAEPAGTLGGARERPTPIVRRIQRQLREQISSGALSPGTKLPSMRQLSGEFACSLGIVKQAVNTLAAQGYLRSSPRRGVFVAERAPTGREIVLVLPHLEIERLHTGLLGVRRGLEGTGHRISIHAGERTPAGEDPLPPPSLTSAQVAGALVMLPSAGEHDGLLPRLVQQGVPAVVLDITRRERAVDVVSIDPVETGRLGMRRLVDLGHRRVVVLEPVKDVRTPAEVLTGIEAAVLEAGLEPGSVIRRVRVERRREENEPAWQRARRAAGEAFAEDGSIAAVLGLGPQLTLGGALAARAAGRSIPEGCSVIGVLGDSSALQSFEPAITIYDNPLREVCERATRRLLARIDGLDEPPQALRYPPVLIERGSVVAAAGRG